MKRTHWIPVLFAVAILACMPAAAQAVYRLPQIANGGGVIQTTFVFMNNGDVPAGVTLYLTGDDGHPLDIPIQGLPAQSPGVFLLQLPAGQTRYYSTDGSVPDLKIGAARVVSTSEIGVTALFGLDVGKETEAGVGASLAATEFVIAVDINSLFNTGLALVNLGIQPANLVYRLYDTAGTLVETVNSSTPVPAQGHLAIFVGKAGGLFPTLTDFKGRMVVSSSTQLAAITLRQHKDGSPLTTLPVVPISSQTREFNLPQVANGGLPGPLGIKTQFILFSLGPSGEVEIELTKQNGEPFPMRLSNGSTSDKFNLDLPSGGSLFLESDAQGSIAVGAAKVKSEVPIGVTAVFSLVNENGTVTVEAGVGDSPLKTEFTLPVDFNNEFNTGVALFNPGSATAQVTLTFLNENHPTAASAERRIAPGKILVLDAAPATGETAGISLDDDNQVSNFVNQFLADLPKPSRGQLAVQSDLPLAAISLRQSTDVSKLTTLPVVEGVYTSGGPTPSSSNLLRKKVAGVDVTSDTTLDVQLSAGFKLSGKVTAPLGYIPIGGIQAISRTGDVWAGTLTIGFTGAGNYSMILPNGDYDIRVCLLSALGLLGSDAEGPTPLQDEEPLSLTFLSHAASATVNGDTNRDFTVTAVPLVQVTGQLQNTEELPGDSLAAGTFVVLSAEQGRTQSFVRVGPDGTFTAQAGTGTYDGSIAFGKGTDTDDDGLVDDFDEIALIYGVGQLQVPIGGLNNAILTIPDLARLSGTVSQPQTQDFSSSQVLAYDFVLPDNSILNQCIPIAQAQGSYTEPAADGRYALTVRKNQLYDVLASIPATEIGTAGEGMVSAPLPGVNRKSFPAEENALDIDIPTYPNAVVLSGKVTGPTGAAVRGAAVTATTIGGLVGASNAEFSANTVTDNSGNYSLTVLEGTNYTVEVDPLTVSSGPRQF